MPTKYWIQYIKKEKVAFEGSKSLVARLRRGIQKLTLGKRKSSSSRSGACQGSYSRGCGIAAEVGRLTGFHAWSSCRGSIGIFAFRS